MNSWTPYRTPFLFKLIVILSIISIPQISPGQNNPDDLIQEISKAKEDTTRFRLINTLVNITRQRNPDSAYLLLKQIIPVAEKVGHKPSILEFYYSLGMVYDRQHKLDSSLYILKKTLTIAQQINDQINQVHVLDQIGHNYYKQQERVLGFQYLKQALALAEKLDNGVLLHKETNNLGRLYMKEEKYDSAEIFLVRSLEVRRQLGNKRMQAEILVNLGMNAFRAKEIEKGLGYFEEAISLMKEIDNKLGLSLTYGNFAYSYYITGDFPNALEKFHQALAIIETTDYHDITLSVLDHLAELYIESEDYDNALLYSQKALETWDKVYGNKENADLLYKQGRVFLFKKKYIQALESFQRSAQLQTAAKKFIHGDYYWNLGQCFEQLSELDSATLYFQKGIDISQGGGNKLLESQCLIGLGRINEHLGDQDKALNYYQTAYEKARDGAYKTKQMEAAEGLYRIYKKQNNVTQALHFVEISRTLQDSIFNERNTKEIARMQAGFEFEKEKQALAFEQKQENERQNNIRRLLGIALGVTALLLIISFFYFRAKQLANEKLSKLNEELLDQKAIVEKQKERLEELDAVKSHFFTNISHEFRTPLTVINGMAEQMEKDPTSWLEKGIKLIRRNSGQLLGLVNQILDLRKLESGSLSINLTQGDIIPYMRYLLESFHSMAETKGIHLHFLADTHSKMMDYDKEKILRITSNLVSNAIKFTPNGGNIYLRILQSEQMVFQVKDDGIGISPDQLPNIFDRFYQADDSTTRQGEGTGIGLSLTHELVKLLGGTIEVDSKVGRGTTFTVLLPVSQRAPVEQSITVANLSPLVTTGGLPKEDTTNNSNTEFTPITNGADTDQTKLLIVEDNPDVVQYLEGILKDNYQILIAQDGEAGIELALEQIPDLIISDVMMPKKDGFELCETLKTDTQTSHIPIVLLTAKADIDSRVAGLKRGADAYLAKPFNQEELFVRLEKLLELRLRLQKRYQLLEPALPTEEDIAIQLEDAFITNAKTIIKQHLEDEKFGIPELCKAIGISRPQLHRKIKALTNRSTSHFIRSIRLIEAKSLLQSTDLTISEVAYQVGFKDPAYFSRTFSEEFGLPPKEFITT